MSALTPAARQFGRSDHARGGMRTKIEAGKIATTAGTHMVIASGRSTRESKAR